MVDFEWSKLKVAKGGKLRGLECFFL